MKFIKLNDLYSQGRTQTLDFYSLSGLVSVVDMPGYGFADAPKKIVKQWQELVAHYVSTRVRYYFHFEMIGFFF